jgi:hypothetical protein
MSDTLEIQRAEHDTLPGFTSSQPERNPFRVYLARLGAGSRPTMAEALERIARIASGGTLEAVAFPWTCSAISTSQPCVQHSQRASRSEHGNRRVRRQSTRPSVPCVVYCVRLGDSG